MGRAQPLPSLLPHHQETIARVCAHFQSDPEVRALVLAGSIAHGYARPDSDVDVLIFVEPSVFEARRQDGRLTYCGSALCTYPGGYVDGKYTTLDFVRQVADAGSEAARYAFQDAVVLFSSIPGLPAALAAAAQYPLHRKQENLHRFRAQFEAWYWYVGEALRQQNLYLLMTACAKLVLFGARLILAHNERLYPYHKWLLRVLAEAPQKPPLVLDHVQALLTSPGKEAAANFYDSIRRFSEAWPADTLTWPSRFMLDSELNWQGGTPPIEDL